MYAVDRDGDVVPFAEFQNAWGGAMAVWRVLFDRYIEAVDNSLGFYGMLTDGMRGLFAQAREGRFEPWETVTLMTTCDRVVISIEHVESVASALEEFDRQHAPQAGPAFSVGAQAKELRRMLAEHEEKGWRGVCWNQTSVVDALWCGVPDVEEDGPEFRPYNIDRDEGHWFWPEPKASE